MVIYGLRRAILHRASREGSVTHYVSLRRYSWVATLAFFAVLGSAVASGALASSVADPVEVPSRQTGCVSAYFYGCRGTMQHQPVQAVRLSVNLEMTTRRWQKQDGVCSAFSK